MQETPAQFRHFRHATTYENYACIALEGLHVEASNPASKIKGVWLHVEGRSAWAILHTMQRHNVPLGDVVILDVVLPRDSVVKHGKGLWYSPFDIPSSAIRGVTPAYEIAQQTPVA